MGPFMNKQVEFHLSLTEFQLLPNQAPLLCHMEGHQGAVNVVRWSNSGRFLASGGDDQKVLLWTLEGGQGPGGSPENWMPYRTGSKSVSLAGHAHDVVDLCWSPDDR